MIIRRSWLFVGLASGYCGSATTFSSWNQDAAVLVVRTADVVFLFLCLFLSDSQILTRFALSAHLSS